MEEDQEDVAVSVDVLEAYSEGIGAEIDDEHDNSATAVARKSKSRKQLNARERLEITQALTDVSKNEVQQQIIEQVSKSLHITAIPERAALWVHFTGPGKAELCKFIDVLVSKYTDLYKGHAKGANKYTRFYLAWYSLADMYCSYSTTAESKTWWDNFVHGYSESSAVSTDLRDTLVTTLLHHTFDVLQRKAVSAIEAINDPVADRKVIDEDEVSLLRLGGWAIFSAKKYRENALQGKSKTTHNAGTMKRYGAELKILQHLIMTDKSNLPVGITAQDRGGMTFPHPSLIPYIRSANQAFKEILNSECYRKYGKRLMEVCTHHVANNQQLQREWETSVRKRLPSDFAVAASQIDSIGKVVLLQMLHSQCKEFLVGSRLQETVSAGKTADIDVALRAKLKTHASEKRL